MAGGGGDKYIRQVGGRPGMVSDKYMGQVEGGQGGGCQYIGMV